MDTTTPTIGTEAPFLEILTGCWTKARRGGLGGVDARFRELMLKRLLIDARVLDGLFAGIDALGEYACADIGDEDAIAEEEAGLEASRRAIRPIFEARMQEQLCRIDAEVAMVQCRECGQMAESQGFRRRTWRSGFGEVCLARRYNYCDLCCTGRAVAQEKLGLRRDVHTPRLAESITRLATVVPYNMAVSLAESLVGAEVCVHTAERLVSERAAHVALQTAEEARTLDPFDHKGLQRRIHRPLDAVKKAPRTAYLEMDGVFVMTREEDLDRRQPAEPGSRGGKGRRYDWRVAK